MVQLTCLLSHYYLTINVNGLSVCTKKSWKWLDDKDFDEIYMVGGFWDEKTIYLDPKAGKMLVSLAKLFRPSSRATLGCPVYILNTSNLCICLCMSPPIQKYLDCSQNKLISEIKTLFFYTATKTKSIKVHQLE